MFHDNHWIKTRVLWEGHKFLNKVDDLSNFVAFSEYLHFILVLRLCMVEKSLSPIDCAMSDK